jgi:hypothetical protein
METTVSFATVENHQWAFSKHPDLWSLLEEVQDMPAAGAADRESGTSPR